MTFLDGNSRFTNNNVVATRVDLILFKRTWWRAANVLAVQVVVAVMTSAPNVLHVGSILNDAFKVCADCRESFQLPGISSDQDAWLATELENLPRVNRDFTDLCRDN
jgi:hypothetical protein